MRKRVAILVLAVGMALGSLVPAHAPVQAAPITCPEGQEVQKVGPGDFRCVNNGGNTSGAGHHKGTGDKI